MYVPPAAAETLVDSVAVTAHAWWCAPPHRWAPYIRLLPADGARAAWTLSDAQLRALDDAEEARVARVMRESVHADHARLRDTIRAVLRGSGVPAGTVSAESTLAAFVWARSLVGARAMTVKGERFLVPFADFVSFAPNAAFREAHAGDYFLRHHPVTVSRWDDEGSNGETTRIFGVLADRPMAMNDKVVEDYGDTTNHMCAAVRGGLRCWGSRVHQRVCVFVCVCMYMAPRSCPNIDSRTATCSTTVSCPAKTPLTASTWCVAAPARARATTTPARVHPRICTEEAAL